jgi:hypothetical protein
VPRMRSEEAGSPFGQVASRDHESRPIPLLPWTRDNATVLMGRGVSALRAFDRESYQGPAEANQPTASQSAAHSPNDRNNTAVIDTRSDQ